ncbi:hypothetical protein Tco_0714627 [Tanacetum coccineum]
MDWLSKRKFVIVCHEKVVRIPLEGDEILRVHGERTQGVVKTLMNTKVDEPKLSDISVVRDFIDVFLEDLSMTTTMTNNSKEWNSSDDQLRLRWMIYLVVLADAVESVRDAIGFEYCLASSSGWKKDWESSLTGLELVPETTDKGVVRFGKKGKLAPRYVKPFEILERIGLVAYRLRLHTKLNIMSSASSAATYTSVYTDFEPGRVFWGADEEISDGGVPRVIVYGYDGLPMQPVDPPSPDYVPGPEHPSSPDYVPGPEHPPSPIEIPYVPEPEYPEYLVPSEDEAPMEDQPLPADASPVALSPGYVPDSDPEEDPEEDSEEEHADYPADGGDGDDEPSGDDTDDDDADDDDEEPFEDEEDDEEEESTQLQPTLLLYLARKTVRPEPPMSASIEARIAEHAAAPTPPLPVAPSPLPLPSPLTTSPTDAGAPLGYRAAGIRMRAAVASPPSLLPSTSPRTDVPEAEMPPRKRACLTTPAPGYEIGESSAAGAARQPRPTPEVDTWDEIVEAMMEIAPTTLEGVDQRVTELDTTVRQRTEEFEVRFEEAYDDRAYLNARVNSLFRDRPYHRHTALALDREAVYARIAWTSSEERSAAIEAHVRTLEAQVATLITQTTSLQTRLTSALGRIATLEARDPEPQDGPAEAGSSCVAAALAERDASRSRDGDNSHGSGTGGRRQVPTQRECTYTDFLKCQPMNFKGTEGVVGLTQWAEKMESVFLISNCAITSQCLKWWELTRKGLSDCMFAIYMPWTCLGKDDNRLIMALRGDHKAGIL